IGAALRAVRMQCTVPAPHKPTARWRRAPTPAPRPRTAPRRSPMRLHRRMTAAALFLLLTTATSAAAQRRPSTEALKREVEAEVAGMQKLSQEMVDMVFSLGELGFQEFEPVEYLTGILEREGFTVEHGCADMPTCYVA